jgi:hypothetical protein
MSVMYLPNFKDPAYINKIILEVKNSEKVANETYSYRIVSLL